MPFDFASLTQLSIATLALILGYLLLRQTLPILDRIAQAISANLTNIARDQRELTQVLQRIEALYEADIHHRTRGEVRLRRRRDQDDEIASDE